MPNNRVLTQQMGHVCCISSGNAGMVVQYQVGNAAAMRGQEGGRGFEKEPAGQPSRQVEYYRTHLGAAHTLPLVQRELELEQFGYRLAMPVLGR